MPRTKYMRYQRSSITFGFDHFKKNPPLIYLHNSVYNTKIFNENINFTILLENYENILPY